MAKAQNGDTVRIHYTGRLSDGSEFDSSAGGDPLEFTIGQNEVIPGFENAVTGMIPGEKKTVTIPCDEAYGPHRDEMITLVERDQFPAGDTPEIGQQYEMVNQETGQSFIMTVAEIQDGGIVLDANHPLAGEDLTFDIELVAIG